MWGGEVATIDVIRDRRSATTVRHAAPDAQGDDAWCTFRYGWSCCPMAVACARSCQCPTSVRRLSRPSCSCQAAAAAVWTYPSPPMSRSLESTARLPQGYVTMRVEKSGVGDSQGPACGAIGYSQELDGYRAALSALKRHPSVDPGQVHLLGISLGGVFAPVLAREFPIRGIVVDRTLAASPPPYPGRSARFFEKFAAVDIPAAWSAVDARVRRPARPVGRGGRRGRSRTDRSARERWTSRSSHAPRVAWVGLLLDATRDHGEKSRQLRERRGRWPP